MPSDSDTFVTINTYWEPMRAHLDRMRLEGEGIECYILDEQIVAMDWLYANAVGGAKLQVRESDTRQAGAILFEQQEQAPPPASSAQDAPPAPEMEAALHCPRCGSEDVARRTPGRRWFFALLLILGVGLPVAYRRYECEQCGWRGRRRELFGK